MKIDILCGSGSPNGVHLSDINGENGRIGVGGAELYLLTMCEAWTKQGHEVVLYNNPLRQDGVFEQRSTGSFSKQENRDVLIIYREPNAKSYGATGRKIFWSCDQYTQGDFAMFAPTCDAVVTISPFHKIYFARHYEIREATVIDIPVRTWEYDAKVEKVPNRLIFTSVPLRGLDITFRVFSKIREIIPEASIVITSDYRLWGSISPGNSEHMQKWIKEGNVQFLGAVPRSRLIEEQLKAQIHLYPCTYEELFCIACAESQVAGALPITTSKGALETTNMGVQIEGEAGDSAVIDMFVKKTVEYLTNPLLPQIQEEIRQKALQRFSIEKALSEWDKVLNG